MSVAGELEGIAAAFVRAWNNHDAPALAALFAEDADFVNVVGLWWKSRGEIEEAHARTHSTIFRDSRLSADVAAVKFLRPDVATMHLTWELSGQKNPDGSTGRPRRGILTFVATREGDRWILRTAQNTDLVQGVLAPQAEP